MKNKILEVSTNAQWAGKPEKGFDAEGNLLLDINKRPIYFFKGKKVYIGFNWKNIEVTYEELFEIITKLGFPIAPTLTIEADGQWLADSLVQGYFSLRYQCEYSTIGSSWQAEVATNALHASYLEWCNVNKKTQYDMVSVTVFGKYLKSIYVGRKLKGDVRGYVFGALDAAILAFQNHEKVDLGIERESKTEPFADWLNEFNAVEGGTASLLDATHTRRTKS